MFSTSQGGVEIVAPGDFLGLESRYLNGSNDALWQLCQQVVKFGENNHHHGGKQKPSCAPSQVPSHYEDVENGVL